MSSLPESSYVESNYLSNVFGSTTNSYKFLWLKGILFLLENSNYSKFRFQFSDIFKEMLVFAWYPGQYYKLSFGYWDQLHKYIEGIPVDMEGRISVNKVRAAVDITYSDQIDNQMARYVPYRMLTAWFKEELRGIEDDTKRHKKTIALANDHFDSRSPLYKIEGRSIILHPNWVVYLKNNTAIISGWLDWHWSNYLQDKNPAVPNVARKIDIVEKRGGLGKYKKYWDGYINSERLVCLYTGQELVHAGYTFDHYIPWAYVVHDEPWNILPVTRKPNVNSSKSNNLPSSDYISRFLDQQYGMLQYNYETTGQGRAWKNLVAPYGELLRLSEHDLLQEKQFKNTLREVVKSQLENAKRLGFSSEWKYQP